MASTTPEELPKVTSEDNDVKEQESETTEDKKEEASSPDSCLVAKTSLLLDYPDKLGGFEFWRKTLKQARLVVAPMVDQSELAWRMLSRRHGAQLCFTPMLHSVVFCRDARYRRENFTTCPEDRPLITQFCANDPEKFLIAARLAEDHCDAIDLNLGCPQMIAKRGHYGAFLQEDWELLHKMVNLCHKHLKVPITCKMRVLDDVDKTIQYAKVLESAGCQLLTVHGRTREQKGIHTGLADWSKIKAVKDAMSIPVYANGNIQYMQDVERCIAETGVDGVMTAEGNLHNPALFTGGLHTAWDLGTEYVDLYEKYPCPLSFIRGHLFKIFHHCLHMHLHLRQELAKARLTSDFRDFIQAVKDACKEDVEKYEADPTSLKSNLPHPYWMCQPYERPKPDDEAHKAWRESNKRPLDIPDHITTPREQLSKNKIKRIQHNPFKNYDSVGRKYEDCTTCGNPKGESCQYKLCKKCCRAQNRKLQADCPGHHLFYNKERRLAYQAQKAKELAAKAQNENPADKVENKNQSADTANPTTGNGCEPASDAATTDEITAAIAAPLTENGKVENTQIDSNTCGETTS